MSIALTCKGEQICNGNYFILLYQNLNLCFEFQAWFSFFSKKFSVWWIPGRSYFFFAHKSAKEEEEEKKKNKKKKEEEEKKERMK